MKPAALCATVLLMLVALAHLLRIFLQAEVTADGIHIPMWVSGVACLVAGSIALLLWSESRR